MAEAAHFTRSELTEIAAHIVELQLGGHDNVQVEYDAKPPDKRTHKGRQVDVAVRSEVSRRSHLRIVEVQHRTRRVGSQFVDTVDGKRRTLGAHRATIVATAGFTGDAVERLRAQQSTLDGMVLRTCSDEEWAPNLNDRVQTFNGTPRPVVQFAYENAVDGHLLAVLQLVDYRDPETHIMLCDLLGAPGGLGEPMYPIRTFVLTNSRHVPDDFTVKRGYRSVDGEEFIDEQPIYFNDLKGPQSAPAPVDGDGSEPVASESQSDGLPHLAPERPTMGEDNRRASADDVGSEADALGGGHAVQVRGAHLALVSMKPIIRPRPCA